MLQFEVECYTEPGQHVGVCGSGPLGEWDVARCLLLGSAKYPIWSGEVCTGAEPVEFKYVLVKRTDGAPPELVKWETSGANRRANLTSQNAARLILHHFFGDPDRNSIQIIAPSQIVADSVADSGETVHIGKGEAKSGIAGELKKDSDPSDSSRSVGTSAISTAESVLESLNVPPSVTFSRVNRTMGAFKEKYDLLSGHVLGTGMSGGVVLAKTRSTGSDVAVKTLSTENDSPQKRDQILSEVQNQLAMDHPNICRLLEVFVEPGRLILVMERMRGRDLFDHLSKKGRYTEHDAATCVRQMCAAVAFCHRNGVVHRDLKLENFCLEDDSHDARVKLIDFGLSATFDPTVPLTDSCGTLYYVAPEVLRQKYDMKCDMWSLGVITYILLDGRAPFQGPNDRATALMICRGQYKFEKARWAHISDSARDFVSKLLQVNPKLRMDADEALAHRWLTPSDAGSEALELDPQVLENLKTFTRSNALKRAVLRAMTPLATVHEVARWADAFEALDPEGTGIVEVRDLTQRLVDLAEFEEEEAAQLCAALADADEGEQISYSAFLAACLSSHVKLTEEQLRALFQRLDPQNTGHVTAEEIHAALGDLVDPEVINAEFNGKALSYTDFKWVMTTPRVGPTILGLRQLLGAHGDLTFSWKVASKKAKRKPSGEASDDEETLEAARHENMAWRLWNKHMAEGTMPEEDEMPNKLALRDFALGLDAHLLHRGLCEPGHIERLPRSEKRKLIIDDLVAQGLGSEEKLQEMSDDALVKVGRGPRRCESTGSGFTQRRCASTGSGVTARTCSAQTAQSTLSTAATTTQPHQQQPPAPSPTASDSSAASRPNPTVLQRPRRHSPDTFASRRVNHRTATKALIQKVKGDNSIHAWEVATTEAKEGISDAVRRENMAWRVAALEKKRTVESEQGMESRS